MKENDEDFKMKKHKEALRKRQSMERCPVCNVYESVITNFHCVNMHGMTKKEVEAKYGKIMLGREVNKLKNKEAK